VSKIFVGIPAYNEEDIALTLKTLFGKAHSPIDVHVGLALHYPAKNFPDVSMFPNVNVTLIDEPVGLGTCPTRALAAQHYNGEEYYLQIDGHTIFKKKWDVVLKANYKDIQKKVEKPIITGYVPDWHRDSTTSQPLTSDGSADFEKYSAPYSLVDKNHPTKWVKNIDAEKFKHFAYRCEGVNSPAHLVVDFKKEYYVEHHLTSGHFLFTSGNFLKEVPLDPLITYHEENTTPLRAWTRGYRMFAIKDHVLWTREMMVRGRDVPNSWRSNSGVRSGGNPSLQDKITHGCLRNKDILTGKIIGEWGAPSKELLEAYELASGINYKEFYEEMYKEVENNRDQYYAAQNLYDLEKLRDQQSCN